MAPARSLLRVCCAALCLTSPLVGESPQPEQAAAVLEFYRTTSPETIDSGRAAELIQKYRGKEDKLLSKLQREAAELERLDIAWKFKWLRGTVWRWAPQGSDAAEATFGRDGRFLVADPRCIGGKCTWKTTKATVQVHVGELVYRLNAPATPKSTLSGDVKSGAEDHTVSAEFVRDGEDGQVQELVTKTWDNAVKNKKAVLVNFYSGQKLQNGQHWCGPCVQLAPEFDKAAQELFSDGLTGVMYKVDGNKQDSQRLLQKFGIRSYPTMVVLMEGISVDIYSEAQAASAIADYMRQFLMPPPDYYLTLGVSKDAKASDIKKKFRELSRELHPDTGTNGGDPERFALVTSAYETLSDVDLRSMYDAFGGIKFHRKGMQRNYMQHKGIKLKLYQEEGGAVKAWTATDFQNRDRRKPHVVDFYAPWCGHCQELRPEFHKVALALESKAEFVSIDCDTEGNLCQQMEIRGYPQVRLIWPSKKIEEIYNGDLKEDPIKEWVEDALDSLLVELTPATYAKDVLGSSDTWLVDFSAGSWCGPCTMLKKTVRGLSRSLAPRPKQGQGGAFVGIIDCDAHGDFCAEQEVTGYPAIKVCEVPKDRPSGNVECSPLENNYNLQMGIILELWADGFAAGARAGRSAAVAAGVTGEGVDDSLGEDGFDFSAFEDNDEGSFDDADGKAEL